MWFTNLLCTALAWEGLDLLLSSRSRVAVDLIDWVPLLVVIGFDESV